MEAYQLTQVITERARITCCTSTLIDLFIMNHTESIVHSGVYPLAVSVTILFGCNLNSIQLMLMRHSIFGKETSLIKVLNKHAPRKRIIKVRNKPAPWLISEIKNKCLIGTR